MKSLMTTSSTPLHWIQPKTAERLFELRTGDDWLVAMLRFERSAGTLATAESADGNWTFKRIGFLNPRVTVREPGTEVNLAIYYPKLLGGGSLEFSDERVFNWEPANFWETQWCFVDVGGEPLVIFKPGADELKLSDLFKTQALVEVTPQGSGLIELPLLVLLGWYLIILRQEDA